MSKKLKSYLDDENFLKAKKVWSEFERKQNKYFNSPQNYKDKILPRSIAELTLSILIVKFRQSCFKYLRF